MSISLMVPATSAKPLLESTALFQTQLMKRLTTRKAIAIPDQKSHVWASFLSWSDVLDAPHMDAEYGQFHRCRVPPYVQLRPGAMGSHARLHNATAEPHFTGLHRQRRCAEFQAKLKCQADLSPFRMGTIFPSITNAFFCHSSSPLFTGLRRVKTSGSWPPCSISPTWRSRGTTTSSIAPIIP